MVILITIGLAMVLSIAGIWSYFAWAPQFGGNPDKEEIQRKAINSIYRKGKFYNAYDVPLLLPNSVPKLFRLQFKDTRLRTPSAPLPFVKESLKDQAPESVTVFRWLGHSTIFFQIDGLKILTDPVLTRRASPVSFSGPAAFKGSQPYSPEEFPELDYVLLSHDHFDHLDYKTIKKLYPKTTKFIVPLGVECHLIRWGVSPEKIISLDWWQERQLSEHLKLISSPAQHFTGRRRRSNDTLWCSWILNHSGTKYFFNGDSGYSPHFKEIGDKYGPFALTMLECGAYGDYWPYIHMKPEETHQAHLDLKGEKLLPIHWAKFNLAFHPWDEPIGRLMTVSQKAASTVLTPLIGEPFNPRSEFSFKKWWEEIG